jgi:hypothetical protein
MGSSPGWVRQTAWSGQFVGCQQFSALHARLAGSGDTTIAKASLNQWEAGGSKARYHLFLSERSKPSNIIFQTIIVPKER